MHTYEVRNDHLFVHVTDPVVVTPSDFQELGDVCRREHLNKILIDMRAVRGKLSTFERYKAGLYVATLIGPKIRVAAVAQTELITYVAETVALNRYGKLKVGSDMEEALAWLGVEKTEPTR